MTCIECSFAPFDAELLERRGSRLSTNMSFSCFEFLILLRLEGQPVFHTFWTDVTDLDTYKQVSRDWNIRYVVFWVRQHFKGLEGGDLGLAE